MVSERIQPRILGLARDSEFVARPREPPTCARWLKSSRELAVGCEAGHISVFRVGGPDGLMRIVRLALELHGENSRIDWLYDRRPPFALRGSRPHRGVQHHRSEPLRSPRDGLLH